MTKVDKYIFFEITKGCLLIFFIFLSISWLLQFTRLISLTNLIQVDIFTILFLSTFLIPNLVTIIMPFVIMFGLIITFLKLHKDRELISIFSLGLNIKPIFKPLIYFSSIIFIILLVLNFYFSPISYKKYKLKEYEIRNTINFEKIKISNFIEINKNTYLDFKKEENFFKEFFLKFTENEENIIFAREADISQKNDYFLFKLFNGFKITLLENNKIEKLEFDNYTLKIENSSFEKYDNFDTNTIHIFEDIKNKNYLNIAHKISDSCIFILIILLFYYNNIKKYNFYINNIILYLVLSTLLLLLNQIFKNINLDLQFYLLFLIILIISTITFLKIKKNNVKN